MDETPLGVLGGQVSEVLLYKGSDEDQDGPCWKLSWKEDGDDDEDSDEANERMLPGPMIG